MSKFKLPVIFAAVVLMLGGASTSAFAQRNPTDAESNAFRNKPCRDPWLSIALINEYGRDVAGSGDADACAPKLYNGGQWNNYADLVRYVRDSHNAFTSAGLSLVVQGGAPALKVSNVQLAKDAGISDAIMGKVVAAGAGNVVAAGAGNVVAAGGGNFSLQSATEYHIKIGGIGLRIRK
jgi:hypothetical protein